MEITFLGGAGEVGRSAVQLDAGSDRFLLDYGLDVQYNKTPQKPRLPLKAVFITHSHMDHSGMVPSLYTIGYEGSVYSTDASLAVMEILLRDSLKVQKKRGEKTHFLPSDIPKTMRLARAPKFGVPFGSGKARVTFLDAGHIPGSASILIEAEGKKLLYTGDIKFMPTRLMKGAGIDVKGLDALIIESTYSGKDHPERSKLEDRFRELAQETLYNNGHLIVPCFAVGRTQEMLLMLYDLGFPMCLDGMGIEVTKAMLEYPGFLKDRKALARAFSKARKVTSSRDRKAILEKPSVILCTAGMLNGGPVGYYIKNLHDRENCTLAMTGYQVEGTVGRVLMETGRYVFEDMDVKPKMRVEFLDFSAHTDRTHLIEYFKRTRPRKIFLVHGDRTAEFARELKSMGFNAQAPRNGERVRV